MNKFKIGDKVRLLKDGYMGYLKKGDVTEVQENDSSAPFVAAPDSPHSSRIAVEEIYLELVSHSKQTELQMLIEKANEGARATVDLRKKYYQSYEVEQTEIIGANKIGNTQPWRKARDIGWSTKYREIPAKPKFESYQAGVGLVKITDDVLHVGCQQFHNIKHVVRELGALIAGYILQGVTSLDLRGSKQGVHYMNHTMSWKDAEDLLAALKKAGYSE